MTLVHAETGEVVRTLADHEATIERGLATFVEVGEALAAIRDGNLYRQGFDTFEAYCRDRWGFNGSRARQLIGASETVTTVTAAGGPAPKSERAARALAPVKHDPPTAAAAMRAANDATCGKPTAAAIEEAVADALAEQEAKAEDKAALRKLEKELNPKGFNRAENERVTRLRGQFSAACKTVVGLGTADALVEALAAGDRADRFVDLAEAAYGWLDEFLLTWRERQ